MRTYTIGMHMYTLCMCKHTLARNPNSFLLFFPLFYLLVIASFNLVYLCLSLCLSVLFCFISLKFARALDGFNAMNMHMNMIMHWCISVVMQWDKQGKSRIITWSCIILLDEYDIGNEHNILDWIPCFWYLDVITCLFEFALWCS